MSGFSANFDYIRTPSNRVMSEFVLEISSKLGLDQKYIAAVLELSAEGATVPFIARYRKDRTGAMDEVQIQRVIDEANFLKEFYDRRAFIEKTITEQGKMTDELREKLMAAVTLSELEDIYLPYKPKRKTRAQTAREKGLEPLALILLAQNDIDLAAEVETFLGEQVATTEEALQGARDIIAEMIHEDAEARAGIRKLFEDAATIQSKVLPDKETEGAKYKDYFDFSEPVTAIPSHRALAVLRGFMEGVLRMTITPPEEDALERLEQQFLIKENAAGLEVKKAIKDAWRRLLQPGMESEFRMAMKTRADEEAITVFSENLRQLLLSSPLGSKRILAIDPGYRTGCKVVCLDENGTLKATDLIYIHEQNNRLVEAENKVRKHVESFRIEAVAVGDGTAGRETEQFIRNLNLGIPIFLVNEDGASVYSASETAREEFPDQDITVRGAVSIGRRLMDPLAELVKIDPKSIGVGQYQHDVNQVRLKEKLDQTVVSCVNIVGVNLNTASRHLLSYVSGIGPVLAANIVKRREEIGGFSSRKDLLEVPRLGQKAYEQCAGFLRVRGGKNPLDASAVHPESYPIVEQMAADLGVAVEQLIGNEQLIQTIQPQKYVTDTIGMHTIQDILKELRKPAPDPRSEARAFEFANIFSIEEVVPDMIVPGIVTNITRFGAFVDIGVKQDGLVHVSEMAHRYISDPNEVLKLNQQVMVKVLEVDLSRKRISLSIRQATEKPGSDHKKTPKSTGSGGGGKASRKNEQPQNLEDALSLLKKRFGK